VRIRRKRSSRRRQRRQNNRLRRFTGQCHNSFTKPAWTIV
jgi:hypothetical protein